MRCRTGAGLDGRGRLFFHGNRVSRTGIARHYHRDGGNDRQRGNRSRPRAQPLFEPVQGEFDIPGLQYRAAVQIQSEPGHDVKRFQQSDRADVVDTVSPSPLAQLLEPKIRRVELDRIRGRLCARRFEHPGQGVQRVEGDCFKVHAYQCQPDRIAAHPAAERIAAAPAGTSGLFFQLCNRHGKRACRAEPVQREIADQSQSQPLTPVAQRVSQSGNVAKYCAACGVQHRTIEQRLEPPQQQHGMEFIVKRDEACGRRGQVECDPDQPDRTPPLARHLKAQVHGFPASARAQLHCEAIRLHASALTARGNRSREPTLRCPRHTSHWPESRFAATRSLRSRRQS